MGLFSSKKSIDSHRIDVRTEVRKLKSNLVGAMMEQNWTLQDDSDYRMVFEKEQDAKSEFINVVFGGNAVGKLRYALSVTFAPKDGQVALAASLEELRPNEFGNMRRTKLLLGPKLIGLLNDVKTRSEA